MRESRYYPIRMFRREDVREVFKALEARTDRNTRVAEDIAFPAVIKRMTASGVDFSGPGGLVAVTQECQGVLACNEWALAGKRILDFTPELTNAFLNCDCGDMRISDGVPDYPFQYFRFEIPEDKPIFLSGGRVTLEGALVLYARESMRVVLTGKPVAPLPPNEAYLERYDLRIKSDHYNKPAQEAINLALADDLEDLEKAVKSFRSSGKQSEANSAEKLAKRMKDDHAAYALALRLVLNACAYLRIEAADNSLRWPDEAPEKLVRQAEGGSSKERDRAKSKLWSLGYVPIFHIGEDFGRKYRAARSGPGVHIRRYHWRNQPYGPKFAFRKLILIAETVVGASKVALEPSAGAS